ncbi:hypothetical protein STURON_00929 [Spiroplasma turonicum]|uniref:Uncharacterized protein n=2 Tax=Spiroplasma turonicum TaxID=216946 RepID=A0A0K1P7A6_9MOLU|nr:hypothetical protein [Spiroplasma turonicum]AKU80175.1 hypothetical protein STURON_00929 [Spiroplasma turonicum]ALX71175.1 hypothetical protein STURO_v1c09240 [Spiroplasma turonicum]
MGELTYKENKNNRSFINYVKNKDEVNVGLTNSLVVIKSNMLDEDYLDQKQFANFEYINKSKTKVSKTFNINGLQGQELAFENFEENSLLSFNSIINSIFVQTSECNNSLFGYVNDYGDFNELNIYYMTIKGTKGENNFNIFVYKIYALWEEQFSSINAQATLIYDKNIYIE